MACWVTWPGLEYRDAVICRCEMLPRYTATIKSSDEMQEIIKFLPAGQAVGTPAQLLASSGTVVILLRGRTRVANCAVCNANIFLR